MKNSFTVYWVTKRACEIETRLERLGGGGMGVSAHHTDDSRGEMSLSCAGPDEPLEEKKNVVEPTVREILMDELAQLLVDRKQLS